MTQPPNQLCQSIEGYFSGKADRLFMEISSDQAVVFAQESLHLFQQWFGLVSGVTTIGVRQALWNQGDRCVKNTSQAQNLWGCITRAEKGDTDNTITLCYITYTDLCTDILGPSPRAQTPAGPSHYYYYYYY